jgi:hypothetical protein
MSALTLGHRYRMWRWRRLAWKREMASWPTPPTDAEREAFFAEIIRQWRHKQ